MEKQERERRKEEERLLREKQREEERTLREQKREMERREKFLQKEYLRVNFGASLLSSKCSFNVPLSFRLMINLLVPLDLCTG